MGLIKTSFLPLLVLSTWLPTLAQKTVIHQNLYWVRYYNQLSITRKLAWQNEIEDRRFVEKHKQHHFIVHSRIHYKVLSKTDVALGLTYALQSPHAPKSATDLVVPEVRTVQEINFSSSLAERFSLQQRLRIDERFIHKNDGKNLLNGYSFNFRFRYRLQASYRLSRDATENMTILKVSDELMINAGKNIIYNQFDQNRIYAGLEQGFSKNLALELGYLHWYQQRSNGTEFFNRDIVRLTLHHKLKFWK